MDENTLHETYLGDGVYASYDVCGNIILDLRCQDESKIVLEPEVFKALCKFDKKMEELGI